MADLDDFFAKKDRKKCKSKKFPTAEEMAKKLEDSSKPADKQKKERLAAVAAATPAVTTVGGVPAEPEPVNTEKPAAMADDEWREYEKEKGKDYTGLKLAQLQIKENNKNVMQDCDFGDYGENGSDSGREYTSGNGPWKTATAAANAVAVGDAVGPFPANGMSLADKLAGGNKVYVSPALRNQPLRMPKMRKGVAPDIQNEDYFPSLAAAKPEEMKKKKREPAFEEVRHGGRFQRSNGDAHNTPVTIGNRFNSLADN